MTLPEANGATVAPASTPPPAQPHPLSNILLIITLLAILPAILLAVQRVQFEQSQKTVAMVMDYPTLVTQARRFGQDPLELLEKYKKLGINGVAIYEDVVGNLEQRGEIYMRSGAEMAVNFPGSDVKTNAFYMRSLKPGIAENLPKKFTIPTRQVKIGNATWVEWPSDPLFLPVGPPQELIDFFKKQKLTIIYRPYGSEAVKEPAADWPDVPFVAFNGEEVIGARTPELLATVSERMGKRLPALIEASPQRGLDQLIEEHGAARLFSINPAWQERLQPIELASKYNLAARERSMRLLYMRPYPSINETEDLLKRTSLLLKESGITVTNPDVQPFEPNSLFRMLSIIGPITALLLLGLSFPLRTIGLLAALFTALISVALNKANPYASAALIAAVTFPALGFVLRRHKPTDWFIATGLSLAGVLFVSALGASRESTLGIHPFSGVGLTLLLPLLLVAASFLPKQDLRLTAAKLYNTPIKLGDMAMIGIGLALFALAFLRRGNATGASVSSVEADARTAIQDSIVRPRFKEVAAHPLGILGVSNKVPSYFGPLLILAGVVGQSSILNTFSHFHTPLLISATRCFLGLGFGLLLGLIAIQVLQFGIKLWKNTPLKLPETSATSEKVQG